MVRNKENSSLRNKGDWFSLGNTGWDAIPASQHQDIRRICHKKRSRVIFSPHSDKTVVRVWVTWSDRANSEEKECGELERFQWRSSSIFRDGLCSGKKKKKSKEIDPNLELKEYIPQENIKPKKWREPEDLWSWMQKLLASFQSETVGHWGCVSGREGRLLRSFRKIDRGWAGCCPELASSQFCSRCALSPTQSKRACF